MRTTYLTLIAIGLMGFAAEANAQYYASSPYAHGPYWAQPVADDGTDTPAYALPPGSAPRASASRAYESQPLPPPGTTYPPSTASQPPAYGQPQSLQPPGAIQQPATASQQPAYGQPQSLQPPGTTYPSATASQQPSYGQSQPPAYGQSQPPAYGQSQPPAYGQSQPPAYGQSQPPAYGQSQPPAYGQSQPPAYASPREAYVYPGGASGQRPGANGDYGFAPLRPPGEIGGQATPSYAPAPPPGSVPSSAEGPTGSISASRAPAATPSSAYASFPADYRPEEGKPKPLPPKFQRQIVDFSTTEPAGTLVVDTPNTFLYLVLDDGKALRYGIGVGREGFTWSGVERVTKMAEWPDWHPPKEMIERQPYLPRFMAGGESSPLGARALYLGKTIYRIHGTNQPSTIGTFVSSGCIRLTNDDVQDLYQRVQVGTRVVVLPKNSATSTTNGAGSASSSVQLPNHSQVR